MTSQLNLKTTTSEQKKVLSLDKLYVLIIWTRIRPTIVEFQGENLTSIDRADPDPSRALH